MKYILQKPLFIIAFFLTQFLGIASKDDTLYLNYFQNVPFTFNEGKDLKGIEIDILNEYAAWLKTKKNLNFKVKFIKFTDFESFCEQTKKAGANTIGLGSVTINSERRKELDFTAAYIKNVAFCITNGNAPDIKTKNPDEIVRVLGHMTALTIRNSSLYKYTLEIKKTYVPELKIAFQPNPQKILDEISKNVLHFGYVDAVSFWIYLKSNPGRFLRMQKILNQSKEELGFITSKGSRHVNLFNEFFEGQNGFKNSTTYRAILEKYLGTYMTQNMAIN